MYNEATKNNDLRKEIIKISYENKLGHIASALSMVNLLDDFFENKYKPNDGDMFYCGKPYGSQAFDVTMRKHGYGSVNVAFSGLQESSEWIHMVEATLGNALGVAVGAAYANKLRGKKGTIYCLMGDAAMTQGVAWEAVQLAAKLKLDNIHLMVDNNKMGIIEEESTLHNFREKFTAFGWDTYGLFPNKPVVTVYKTVKGKGVSYMEQNPEWHYKTLDEEHYLKAMEELNA